MLIEKIVVGPLDTNCYLVGERGRPEIIIIDPAAESRQISGIIEQNGFRPKMIVITHGHPDHIEAAPELSERFGCPIFIHRADEHLAGLPLKNMKFLRFKKPKDAQISAGKLKFKVIETPGHTPGSISLLCQNNLFCGDLLFKGGIGRTDLPGGNDGQMIKSLKKIMALPDETKVWSGHGPETTIGQERRTNPFSGIWKN